MKRLILLTSVLAFAAAGCATNENAGAPDNNPPAGDAYLYPYVPPGTKGREAAAITPPILTDSGYVSTGVYETTPPAAVEAPPPASGAPVVTTESTTGAGASAEVIPPGTTVYQFRGGAAFSGSPAVTTETTTGAATSAPGYVSTAPLSDKDQRFVRDASEGAKAQIALGQMMVQRASDQDMRDLGQRLIDDNTRAYDQLSQIAAQKGISVASAPADRMQKSLDRMSSESGRNFDKDTVGNARHGAAKQVELYNWASNSAQDPDLRAFAQQNLSAAQQDNAEAQQVEDRTGGFRHHHHD
jgi:putative membrane protein